MPARYGSIFHRSVLRSVVGQFVKNSKFGLKPIGFEDFFFGRNRITLSRLTWMKRSGALLTKWKV